MREAYLATEQSSKVFVPALADDAAPAGLPGKLPPRYIDMQKSDTLPAHDLVEENRTLLGNYDFIYRIFDGSPDCINVLDLEGNIRIMNAVARRVMEIDNFKPYVGVPWLSFWPDEQKPKVIEALHAAVRGLTGHFQAAATTAKETPKWWDVVVTAIRDSDGEIVNLLAISRDITAERELYQRQEFLMRELEHRVKNTLAVVQSIAQQTFKPDASPVEAKQSFIARLGMLNRANDILLRDNWESSSLEDLVNAALAPYGDKASRFTVNGPFVQVSGQATLGLALALHELATNAAKYGALSNSEGKVDIRWVVEGDEENALFNFYWMESGGPAITVPTKKGFGSRMIEFTVASQFRGEAKSDYRPSGLIFEIVAPLSALG